VASRPENHHIERNSPGERIDEAMTFVTVGFAQKPAQPVSLNGRPGCAPDNEPGMNVAVRPGRCHIFQNELASAQPVAFTEQTPECIMASKPG
jgi:hypothetical protein